MRLDAEFLKKVVPEAQLISGTLGSMVTFSLDSRTISENELFIPVKGERVDGHDYLPEALAKGKGAFVAESKKTFWQDLVTQFPNALLIVVSDPKQAFFDLAAAWRARFDIPVVAVTGSVGKTSTKTLIANILTASGKNAFVSFGNQNTMFGVSLNMARLTPDHDVAVFETGINKRGEMARIIEKLQPTTGVITCIGHSHMEGLGSLHDIATEKRDIFKFFKEDSIGVINGDQSLLSNVGYTHPVIKFGTKTTNQVQARKVKVGDSTVSFVLKLYGEKYAVEIPGQQKEIITNLLAAAAVSHYLGVAPEIIVQELQKPQSQDHRFQPCPLKMHPGVLIDDAYNASPESVKAALLALQRLKTKAKKIVVLGDMLELGSNGPFWHRQIGRFLRKIPSLNHLILVGDQVQWTHKTVPVGIDVEIVPSWKDAAEKLQDKLDGESVVLVKGSRGMQLSKLVEQFADKTKITSL